MGETRLCGQVLKPMNDGTPFRMCIRNRFHEGDHEDVMTFRWRQTFQVVPDESGDGVHEVVDPTEYSVVSPVPENILQEADRLTSTAGKRPDDYGHPRDNLQLTADLWAPILGCTVTAEQVALCMVQLKIARQCHKSGRDNLVDIAGWARTIERLEE